RMSTAKVAVHREKALGHQNHVGNGNLLVVGVELGRIASSPLYRLHTMVLQIAKVERAIGEIGLWHGKELRLERCFDLDHQFGLGIERRPIHERSAFERTAKRRLDRK